MDWSNERWVKLYTRDTADDLVLSWQAQGMWPLLIRKADRAGVIATNHGARGIAALIRWPADVVTPALAELLEDGRIRECENPRGYVLPNFLAAQDASSSDAQRKRDQRERSEAANSSVTKRDSSVTKRDEMSRPSHAESRAVTPRVEESRRDETRVEEKAEAPSADREPEEAWWGNPAPAAPAKAPRVRKVAAKLPQDWTPGPYAIPDGVDPQRELQRFRNHAEANGRTCKDWNAAWRNWLLKAEEFTSSKPKPTASRADYLMAVARGEIT